MNKKKRYKKNIKAAYFAFIKSNQKKKTELHIFAAAIKRRNKST